MPLKILTQTTKRQQSFIS